MKKLICVLALAGISYGTVYADIPLQKHDTTRMREKKPEKEKPKEKKPVRKDTTTKV